MKKITLLAFSSFTLMGHANTNINISDFYTTSDIIDNVSYPRDSKLEVLVNIDNNSIEETLLTLIGKEQVHLKSSVLRYLELALNGERYRFYKDISKEVKTLDLRDKVKTLKPTLTRTSDIELEAFKILSSSIDLSDSQLIKDNYISEVEAHSSYLILKPQGELKATRYSYLVGFDDLSNTLDVDYYNIKSSLPSTNAGVIKFFSLNTEKANYVKINIDKSDYIVSQYSNDILEITSKGKTLNYICIKACPVMLNAKLDLDISLPNDLIKIINKTDLKIIKKENKYKDLDNKNLLTQIQSEESYKIIQTFSTPTKQNLSNLEYKFKEITLNPKEALYFEVPQKYSKMNVSGVTIGHRQSERKAKVDPNPGYSAIAIYTTDIAHDKAWRYWGGHASGPQGAKFAEPRRSSEIDTLFEWPRLGHKSVKKRTFSKELIKANSLRVRNVGTDQIKIDSISLKTIFTDKMQFDDYIFSDGSDFGDPKTFKNRHYAGGQIKKGKFPNALKLHKRTRSPKTSNFPASWIFDSERVFIPLNNINLATVEVMAGDTKPDMIQNKDGGWGSLGNAKLSIGIADNTDPNYKNEVQWLSNEENIGPQGVTPISVNDIQNINGKFLIIRNNRRSSPLYIMGIRIGHQK